MIIDEWNPNKICHNYFLTCITLEYHIFWTQCHSNGKEILTMNQLEHLNANMEGLHLICNFTVKNHIHSFKLWKSSTTREKIKEPTSIFYSKQSFISWMERQELSYMYAKCQKSNESDYSFLGWEKQRQHQPKQPTQM